MLGLLPSKLPSFRQETQEGDLEEVAWALV